MAQELGVDRLPMKNPDFDFFDFAVLKMKELGFRGQELFDVATEALQRLFFNTNTGGRGVIYHYLSWYKNNPKKSAFDEYFKYAFRQKAYKYREQSVRRQKQRGLSIVPGQGQEGEGISEGELGESNSPLEEVQRRDEVQKRENVFQDVPKMLSEQRGGDRLVAIWDLMKKGYKLAEMAEELNTTGVPSAGGGPWGTGSVHKVKNQILGLVRQFLESRGIDWESISASRHSNSKVMFGMKR
jgi:hypothetical protein